MGLDFNDVWGSIHERISNTIVPTINATRVRFAYRDGLDYLRTYPLAATPPNVLLLQYVISDIQGHGNSIDEFINLIARNVVPSMPARSLVVMNDINHYNARDNFERLYNVLIAGNQELSAWRYSFDNYNRNAYQYGVRHENNGIRYPIPQEVMTRFNPWNFCSSAQMIIQKRA